MNGFPWEGLLRLCEFVSICAGVLTVVALIGQVVAGRVVGDVKTVEMEKLRLDVAKQQERAAEAEKTLLELQQRTLPRRLTNEQIQTVISHLRSAQGANIEIVKLGDQESSDFAQQFIEAFGAAGWGVVVVRIGTSSPPRYGVRLDAPESRETEAVKVALGSVGIPVEFRLTKAGSPRLLVGLKPIR